MSAPQRSGHRSLQIVRSEGRSMEPLIRHGAQVGVIVGDAAQLRVGDCAAFTADGRTIVHRVIATKRAAGRLLLREKGDANPTSTWIDAEQVLGRAAWVVVGGTLRRLDAPASSRIAAFLAAAFRLEADVADRVRGLLPAGGLRPLAGLVRLALLPLKAAGLPLLAAAYPAVSLDEGPELDFLLGCFRSQRAPPQSATAAQLDGVLVLQGAGWHGIIPAVLRAAGERLPPQILVELSRRRRHDGLDRLQSIATLREAAGALAGAGIPYVVLKGPALAGLHPGAERPTTDIDVLVGAADVERAAQALAAAGYAARGGGGRRFHFHTVLEPRVKGRLPIELHWDLVDRVNLHRVDAAEVLRRRRELQADGVSFFVPAPEDTLLYLALHAAKHGIFNRAGLRGGRPAAWFCRPLLGNRLLWFSDIWRLLAAWGDSLDWDAMRERAGRWNIGEEIAETLGVLRLLLPDSGAQVALTRLGLGEGTAVGSHTGPRSRDSAALRLVLSGAMTMHRSLHFRPARLAGLARVLAPSPARLRRYWLPASRAPLPLLYLRHPFHIARKVLGARGSRS